MAEFPPPLTNRPPIVGTHWVVSTGHYLATRAAAHMLEIGGNAIDAGVAGGMCINVLQSDMTNIGGVAPIMIYSAQKQELRSISGLGSWPQAVDRDYFVNKCNGDIPPGVHRCVMPAAIDSWLTALKLYGTLPLAEVAAPAIALARDGFAGYYFFCSNIEADAKILAQWPSSREIYLKDGRTPRLGERFQQPDLANMLDMLVEAEQGALHQGREAAIQAARDRFYKGDIAERIAQFFHDEGGFLTLDDLKNFSVDVEVPVGVNYRGYDVYSCRPWCQGPVAPQALKILEGYDLASYGHNSVDTLHLITEALKAAFADRERYYGDPKFVDVPIEGLHSADYNATWRDRIRLDQAFPGMPDPGDPWAYQAGTPSHAVSSYVPPAPFKARVEPDTSYLCVVDEQGNAFSSTPSDGVSGSPIIPGLGFIVSGRGKQSWLDPNHPSVIQGGKRPRLTPSPGMIMRAGRVFAPYGSPGSDVQPQAMVQLAVDLIDFKLDPQAAVEAPRLASYSYPRSDHPHPYDPAALSVEARMAPEILKGLSDRGHVLRDWPAMTPRAGSLCTVVVDHENGFMIGAADPRRISYALGW
ncbi:MAG TPA: gamma-glutamyltransferase family protein [Nitrolancea sp.]